jgi:hypothetical protein
MGFFIEALFGGLMAGMLYSLVALGFVLIFKASGVFNFAQGAMVLFAALAMARFAEWVPQWLGLESKLLGNIIAFALAAACMYVLAWAIERLVLRHLVNQEGVTLLMATLGITYFLDGLGQTIFGSAIYQIDVGMPKEPVFLFEGMFPGGVLINLEDVYAACIAAVMVAILSLFFQKNQHRPCPARCGRRPPGRTVHRHSAQPNLGHCVVCGGYHRPRGRHHLGLQNWRAVLAHDCGAQGTARHHPGRSHFGARSHHRWTGDWGRRKAV